jgi:hypothetical protein
MKDKREKYTLTQRRILNFPLNLGKEWKDTGTFTPLVGPSKGFPTDLIEGYKVLGWENVKIQAGNFKTIKLEYTQETAMRYSGQIIYWYAPEVKYFVKCQPGKFYWNMDRRDSIAKEEVGDWELASFKLQK